jgi:hypothetical protein
MKTYLKGGYKLYPLPIKTIGGVQNINCSNTEDYLE